MYNEKCETITENRTAIVRFESIFKKTIIIAIIIKV